MTQYVLAIDQGTTSSRAILFDRCGRPCSMAQQETRQYFPKPGWVEQDALEIWHAQLAVARQVLAQQQISAADVSAIGIANQRETIVLWDRLTGLPLAPAIVWQDRRTAGDCDALHAAGRADVIRQRTGLVLDAYFSATKLQWLLDHVPGARARAERGELAAGTIDSWLIFKLSGAHLTDPGNASRTMLFNLHNLQWDDTLLHLFDIPRSLLPEIVPSSAVVCLTDPTWFGAPVPIAGIAGDQQAATFGQGCLSLGMAKNTYGTGCFMLMPTGAAPVVSQHGLLATVGWTFFDNQENSNKTKQYLLEGCVFMAGAIVQWLRDGLGLISDAAHIENLAAQVPDAGGVVLVPAFAGLGAPHWDSYARGTIVGMSRGTNKAHIARAALESIAYQNVDVLEAMQKDAGIALREIRVDGGAARNDLLMQCQADMLAIPVMRPVVTESTALGAAYLAGLATGFWSSLDEVGAQWRLDRCFMPNIGFDEREQRLYTWRRALERSRGWIEPEAFVAPTP
ncbi:MAG: glycerol kinase GlpK [Pseudomonadota bacterium]